MTRHTIELEIGSKTYAELVTLDVMLLNAARRVVEDADDMAAIADYEKRRAEGTLKTVSLDELSEELGLDD